MKKQSFFVAGVPVPKGSARSFMHAKTKQIVTRQDNADRQKPWASAISYRAQECGLRPVEGPVRISLAFTMPRLKSHFGTGRNSSKLKPSAPIEHIVKPDIDKLVRCVLDALTGIAWRDDCQVSRFGEMSKSYGDRPGVFITIEAVR